MNDVITLIKQTATTGSYGIEVITEAEKEIYCKVDSISQSEYYAAADTELNPEHRFTIFFGDYDGEEVCEFRGNRYAIYRTYREGDNLELYVERKVGA